MKRLQSTPSARKIIDVCIIWGAAPHRHPHHLKSFPLLFHFQRDLLLLLSLRFLRQAWDCFLSAGATLPFACCAAQQVIDSASLMCRSVRNRLSSQLCGQFWAVESTSRRDAYSGLTPNVRSVPSRPLPSSSSSRSSLLAFPICTSWRLEGLSASLINPFNSAYFYISLYS